MSACMNNPLMRYHGGKWRIAKKIINYFPPHSVYIEPFGGAGSVLFQKPKNKKILDIYNDKDDEIVNVFMVVRDNEEELRRLIEYTPFSRTEWQKSYEPADDPVERARRTLVRAAMSFGSAGATKGKSGFRGVDGSYHHPAKRWPKYAKTLKLFKDRIDGVLIENLDALKIIELYDKKEALFYLDPPYLKSTRSMRAGSKYYRCEMSDEEHEELLKTIRNIEGMAIISGYDSQLYNDMLQDWKRVEFDVMASGHRGACKRTEVLWISPNTVKNQGLFGVA